MSEYKADAWDEGAPHGRTDATPDPHRCTATAKSTGERCKQAALPGAKVCRFHGAGAPQVRAAAGRRHAQALAERDAAQAVALWGGRTEVHPAEALLELVQTKAAEVLYWKLRVAELQEDELAWGRTKREFGTGPMGPVDTEVREAKLHAAYTPTTKQVRAAWNALTEVENELYLERGVDPVAEEESNAEFDRWLNQVRADAWDDGFDTGATHGIAYQAGSNDSLPRHPGLNPYREADHEDH